jgi:hypothetical protein
MNNLELHQPHNKQLIVFSSIYWNKYGMRLTVLYVALLLQNNYPLFTYIKSCYKTNLCHISLIKLAIDGAAARRAYVVASG